MAAATGLVLPTTALHAAAERTRAEIDEQVAASPEVAGGGPRRSSSSTTRTSRRGEQSGGADLLAGRRGFPTADELGAELERFLADRSKGGDQPEA